MLPGCRRRTIDLQPLLGAARARLRRQAALAGRSCAARLRAISTSARPTGAQPASRDLCARISLARQPPDITGVNITPGMVAARLAPYELTHVRPSPGDCAAGWAQAWCKIKEL
eukprot:scaffold57561_cov62-Phaeocystis_antarctica.AAC.1